jgi:hypothetical protein
MHEPQPTFSTHCKATTKKEGVSRLAPHPKAQKERKKNE